MSRFTALAIGIYVNSALYLALVFIAGLVWHSVFAVETAIATVGVIYFTYTVQSLEAPAKLQDLMFLASVFLGVLAGLFLVLGL